jgi:hypothetical protein
VYTVKMREAIYHNTYYGRSYSHNIPHVGLVVYTVSHDASKIPDCPLGCISHRLLFGLYIKIREVSLHVANSKTHFLDTHGLAFTVVDESHSNVLKQHACKRC